MGHADEDENQQDLGSGSTASSAESGAVSAACINASSSHSAQSSPTESCCETVPAPTTAELASDKTENTTTAAGSSPTSASVSDDSSAVAAASAAGDDDVTESAPVTFTVVYKKQKHPVSCSLDITVAALKQKLHSIIDVPPAMQKIMVRGLAPDHSSLQQLGVTAGSKVMVVGSTLKDVMAISKPTASTAREDLYSSSTSAEEKLCDAKMHKKILEKGKPDDVMAAQISVHSPLPTVPLSGMLNKLGGKVRLTFKLAADQLWISTKERTEKVSMSSIKAIVSEPITGHETYHIMGIQLGPTEASRYWIYWVPAQYVNAIKDTVLGKWHYF